MISGCDHYVYLISVFSPTFTQHSTHSSWHLTPSDWYLLCAQQLPRLCCDSDTQPLRNPWLLASFQPHEFFPVRFIVFDGKFYSLRFVDYLCDFILHMDCEFFILLTVIPYLLIAILHGDCDLQFDFYTCT
jgi:hypothetical protein